MPINKIESRSEAAKAFMEGAYFKVGDRFISPDEIVTARRDGSGNPVFKLTTGETVSHERFQQGSVGHFLFEQLRKVEGRYVEQIKPDFNRTAYVKNLYNGAADVIASYGFAASSAAIHRIDTQNGLLFGSGSNTSGSGSAPILKGDLSGNVVKEKDVFTNNIGASQGIDIDPDTETLYVNYSAGTSDTRIATVDYDLTNPTDIYTGIGGVNEKNQGGTIAVLPSEGVGISTLNSTKLFNLDGSGLTSISPNYFYVAADREKGDFVLFNFGAFQEYRRINPSGNVTKTVSLSTGDLEGIAAIPGGKGILAFSQNSQEVIRGNPDGTTSVFDDNVNPPSANAVLDVALDLSQL